MTTHDIAALTRAVHECEQAFRDAQKRLRAAVVDVVGWHTGIRVGSVVRRDDKRWQVTRIEGDSPEWATLYGAAKTKTGWHQREMYIGAVQSVKREEEAT